MGEVRPASIVPDGEPAGQATLSVEVDGVMAPVTARIRLACPGIDGRPATHMLGFGGSEGFDRIEQTGIDVTKTFRATTEVRALCRDSRGGVRRVPPTTVLVVDGPVQRDSVFLLANAARAGAGLARLAGDAALDSVAQAHARDMAERGYFDHVTPEGADLVRRLKSARVTFRAAGENIGGNNGAADVVRAWLDSRGHRENLLNRDFERLGVGVYRTPASPYTYYVQVFAR